MGFWRRHVKLLSSFQEVVAIFILSRRWLLVLSWMCCLHPTLKNSEGLPRISQTSLSLLFLVITHPLYFIFFFLFLFLIFSFEGCGLIAFFKSHPSVVAQAMLFSRKRISQMISSLLGHLTLGLELSPKMTFLDLGRHEVVICGRL